MRPTGANAFRVAVADDRLTIDFGRGGAGGTVTLSDGVRIDAMTAARLLHTLREALQRPAPVAPATTADGGVSLDEVLAGPKGLGATPANLPPDPAAEAAERLLSRVRALDVPYAYERSFRLAPGSLQGNRFLVSIERTDLGADMLDRALEIGFAMGLPAAQESAVRAAAADAVCLHFGFESSPAATICKLYLERRVPADESARAAADGTSVLLHQAHKWDIAGGAHVVTRYDWYPMLSCEAIEARLAALYAGTGSDASLQIAVEALRLAADRIDAKELQYLEVREPDNGRRSFDLNVYDAKLQVRDLLPLLLRMRDVHGVRPGQFQALVDQIRSRSLGHVAGGVHRDGRDFFNVYYGVAGFPQFAGRLS